jgi:hypothetical protein
MLRLTFDSALMQRCFWKRKEKRHSRQSRKTALKTVPLVSGAETYE